MGMHHHSQDSGNRYPATSKCFIGVHLPMWRAGLRRTPAMRIPVLMLARGAASPGHCMAMSHSPPNSTAGT
eukprot:CAMPEP_0202916510 /NCGR_PEP_ID=MMETSP1392-20130828/68729_1 /ASSEMBLY_ACC=CAM_ASM_000868 /TAXON_ID=225041 /ORGANISM="Chlamydomonas chlamydogama, Strain SAG 11-48b" /LENGTH=70 /DNA_ID=CAMNT_0049608965 /DNA_START=128 /DNA_END=337 /DNA_ORIENTATION=+